MHQLIQLYADAQAEVRAKARAVVLGDEQFTYEELCRLSNSLARALQFHGCRRGDRVGLLVSKSPLAIASILGVLKADCIYVPLDVESPPVRSAKILDNCEPALLIVDGMGTKALQQIRSESRTVAATSAMSIERLSALSNQNSCACCLEDILRFSDDPISYKNESNDVAYILYTSGST